MGIVPRDSEGGRRDARPSPDADLAQMAPAVAGLGERFGLDRAATARLEALLKFVASDPRAPTTIREPAAILDQHLADSLVALELEAVRSAESVVDIGSGAGFPGLPLAIARPEARFWLLDSNAKKCDFLRSAAAACGLTNVSIVNARAEEWRDGFARFDLATARALGRIDVLIEYSAPLLKVGGWLVAWRGRRDAIAEQEATRAASILGMRVEPPVAVRPFAAAHDRHLHLILKVMEPPSGFPRRPGVATKRPLGAVRAPASDRHRR